MLIIGISLVILLVLGVPVSFAVGAVSIARCRDFCGYD